MVAPCCGATDLRGGGVAPVDVRRRASCAQQEDEFKEQRRRFREFMEFVTSAPPLPEWAANMTDDELRDMMYDDMLEKERHFVGGDLHVPPAD